MKILIILSVIILLLGSSIGKTYLVETADRSNFHDGARVNYDEDYKRRLFDNTRIEGSHENCQGWICIGR